MAKAEVCKSSVFAGSWEFSSLQKDKKIRAETAPLILNRLQKCLAAANTNHLPPNHSDLFTFSKAALNGNEIKKGLPGRVRSSGGSSSAKSQGFTESLFSETQRKKLCFCSLSAL